MCLHSLLVSFRLKLMTVVHFPISELPNASPIFKHVRTGFTPFSAYYFCNYSSQSDQIMGAADLIYCIYEFKLTLISEVTLHWIN